MSSCLSVNSIPINFSALCIMSLLMRKGVGDGRGEGDAVGVGIWASAFKGKPETVKPAAPAAGRSLTNERRPMLRFFEPSLTVGLLPRMLAVCLLLTAYCGLGLPYLSFTTLAFPVR